MSGNEASGSLAGAEGGCIRGLGMGLVRLSVGGRGCDGKLRWGPGSDEWIVGSRPRAEMEEAGGRMPKLVPKGAVKLFSYMWLIL